MMDREEIVNQLFEQVLHMYGYALGILMRPGGLSGSRAFAELEPMRMRLVELYEAAGRPVPRYLEREEEAFTNKEA